MLRLIPRIEECKKCPWWYDDNDITGCTVPRYHKFDTLPPCTCTMTKPSMNIMPNEDKMNLPMVTPLNLIGDEMKCKECRFVVDISVPGETLHQCVVDDKIKKLVDPETTACWKFKLKTIDKPILAINKLLDGALETIKGISKQEESIAGETVRKELANIAEKTIHPMQTDKPQLQTIPAAIGDAVEVHYKGLHRVEMMVKLPNGVGAAILTGPDGISRLFTQNECYFIKKIPKDEPRAKGIHESLS